MTEDEEEILIVRAGPGANCSSVGSVIDLLFAAGVVGSALLVAVTAALAKGHTRTVDENGVVENGADDENEG